MPLSTFPDVSHKGFRVTFDQLWFPTFIHTSQSLSFAFFPLLLLFLSAVLASSAAQTVFLVSFLLRSQLSYFTQLLFCKQNSENTSPHLLLRWLSFSRFLLSYRQISTISVIQCIILEITFLSHLSLYPSLATRSMTDIKFSNFTPLSIHLSMMRYTLPMEAFYSVNM